ncbi:glycosyltransferase [Bacillus sp. AFS073361]|uniref:glycosyltransferase family 2 protein n=1 Tax=Bacillus sp. AFS073361 TaxID=2033511 RepID=UPI000BF298A0|nr:glycosyltransferase family 2 protein [Bacillus sp. AFS073361]PFP29491.1 glycosyltransferase [Bacillus sp. AFS073361]
MKQLTIFTPTFNRAYCLNNCYQSLKKQTNKDFVWLIVDDGSTDNTKDLVNLWIEENIIEIIYHFQANQGMHGAHNTAYEIIETELNVCIDSDDFMPEQAVEKIITTWNEYGNDKVSGIIGLDSHIDGKIIGSTLPTELECSTLFDLYYKYGVKGDKKLVYRSELTRLYPYPLFQGEKYVGLAYKYYMLDKDFKMILLNEILCCVEYLPDGSSLNMFNQYRRNPKGFSFYRKELMKLTFTNKSFKFRQAIHYVSSNLMLKNWRFLTDSPHKGLTTLAFPLGFLLFLYVTAKTRTA